ncbi:STN domain-containing protein [Serratia bockelmannii]|uniref:STN domain-containing protein n=1 Tax=Serratia bockelmannii TaxID=2703793 RepID=UPI003CF7B63F
MAIKNKNGAGRTFTSAKRTAGKRVAIGVGCALSGMLTSAMAAPGASVPPAAVEQSAILPFAIPAGDLAPALQTAAAKAGVIVIFTPEQTRGKNTAGLQGHYRLTDAFDTLLAGSGLRAQQTAQGYRLVDAGPVQPLTIRSENYYITRQSAIRRGIGGCTRSRFVYALLYKYTVWL